MMDKFKMKFCRCELKKEGRILELQNQLWVSQNNIAQMAGHYAHEYMHILGFGHYKRFLSTQTWREKTFVYKIVNLVAELVTHQINGTQ